MSKQGLRGNTTKRERLRAQAFKMYGKTCNYCGDIGLEVDHVIELAAGGEDSIENLQVLCKNCHKQKTSAFNSKRMAHRAHTATGGVFSSQPAPRLLSVLSLSPLLVSSPPMAKENKL
jgi:5-methylcytosine-specific restriction endonuclease McrA